MHGNPGRFVKKPVILRERSESKNPLIMNCGDGGFDMHFLSQVKENYGIDQCLHWSKQHATGMLHSEGFESTSTKKETHR